MALKVKDYINYIESVINIFTVEDGQIKILLFRKKTEPYKGYWMLPNDMVKNNITIEDTISDVVLDVVGLKSLFIEQCHTFSNCERENSSVITVSYLGLIDSKSTELKREYIEDIESEWFPINNLPKLAFDYEMIINNAIETLGKKINNVNVLKTFFPSDFSLPEIQSVYEELLDKRFDRRNFRKKIISLGIVEPTGDKSEGGTGRPAMLYCFKDNIKEINLF